jgi:predicted glycosyltransferase
MRILCYAQNLIGVGHFVRMLAIARGLGAAGHEVHLVDGGRAVPRRGGPFDPSLVTLPRLVRVDGRLAAEEPGRSVADVMAERNRRLTDAAARIAPEALLVDHYPFSRWELDGEITDTIAAARRAHPDVSVVCSVRDNLWSNFRSVARDAYERGVLARLEECFDGLLIHSDPGFSRLEDAFSRAGEITLPRRYTGFVVDRPAPPPAIALPPEPYAILSCGGSTTNLEFLLAAIDAFRRLRARQASGAMRLLVFPGPIDQAGHSALRTATGDEPYQLFGFSPDFPAWLAGSALSISRAGYNTCGQILASGTRCILVPNPDNAEQAPRARRLAELGLATVLEGDPPDADAIASAMASGLARPPARHALDLDGVAATCALLEEPWLATKVR